jgi:hypothetical protein
MEEGVGVDQLSGTGWLTWAGPVQIVTFLIIKKNQTGLN